MESENHTSMFSYHSEWSEEVRFPRRARRAFLVCPGNCCAGVVVVLDHIPCLPVWTCGAESVIVEGGKTWRGNWGRLAVCDRMQSHFTGFKYHREMVEQDILLGWQQRENGPRKWGKHPAYLLSSLSGTFSQVHQRGRFDWGRPSCPPSPVGCPSGLCCLCCPLATQHPLCISGNRAGSLPALRPTPCSTDRPAWPWRSPSQFADV